MRRGRGELTGAIMVLLLLFAGYYFFLYQPGTSLISMEFTLNYADGTTKTILVPTTFGSQAIIDPGTGSVLASITWTVRATPTWTGTATRLELAGSTDAFVVEGANSNFKQSYPISQVYTSALSSGSVKTVQTQTLQATTLEGWAPLTGTKILRLFVTVDGTMTSSAGVISTITGERTADFTYQVTTDGLVGLNITVTVTGS